MRTYLPPHSPCRNAAETQARVDLLSSGKLRREPDHKHVHVPGPSNYDTADLPLGNMLLIERRRGQEREWEKRRRERYELLVLGHPETISK